MADLVTVYDISSIGANDFGGLVKANNGFLYGIPYRGTVVLKWNATNNTFSTFPLGLSSTSAGRWQGGVLASNGMIYGIPNAYSQVLKINPNNDTVAFFGAVDNSTYTWNGGVQAPNGYIYGIPHMAALSILKINPNNDTVSTFGSWLYSGGWNGGCLDSAGRIFAAPLNSSTVLIIDTNNDTWKTLSVPAAGTNSTKWAGGVLAANGMIYCAPANATSILKIDPVNEVATTFGSFPAGSQKWMGIVKGINGKLYCIPGFYTTTTILCIDPSDDSYTQISGVTGSGWYYGGGAVANNNDIYAAYTQSSTSVKPVLRILLQNMVPVASASRSPNTIYWGQNVTLNGSASYDTDGSVVRWKWYINSTASEANVIANVTTGITTVSYTTIKDLTGADGTFSIYLVVQDNDGTWSTNTAMVPLNLSSAIPVAGASLSPSTIYEVWSDTTTLNGSTSVGSVVRWKWYVNSTASESNVIADVSVNTTTVNYATIKAITGTNGTFDIYLKVQDHNGYWSVNPISVPLTLSTAAPVAGLSLIPSTIVWNQSTTLDGSSSVGAITRWKWYINSPVTFIDWTTPGTYSWTATSTSVTAEVWGGGGAGCHATYYDLQSQLVDPWTEAGGGGGGGGYARSTITGLTIGQNYTIVVGAGGVADGYNYTPLINGGVGTSGGLSYFIANDVSGVSASGGSPAGVHGQTIRAYFEGYGGVGLNGAIKYSGGNGGLGSYNAQNGGGGGAASHYSGNGNNGSNPTGGAAGSIVMGSDGGRGNDGGISGPSWFSGDSWVKNYTQNPGGGGGGGGYYGTGSLSSATKYFGSPGGAGKVRLSFGITGDDTSNTIADVATSTTAIDYTTLKWKASHFYPGFDGTFNIYLLVQDMYGVWSTNTAVAPITLTVAPNGPVGIITGYVWNDLNADGIWDVGEPPLGGQYVYWDMNDSDSIAIGEPAGITAADGSYMIQNVPSGPPRMIRVVLPAPVGGVNWRHTYPVYGGPPYPPSYGYPWAHKIGVIPGGNVMNVTFGITLEPARPVANANGPYGPIGITNSITLNSTGSYSSNGTLVDYKWYLNHVDNPTDVNLLATGASPTLSYAELKEKFGGFSGTRTLLLIVQDNFGVWSNASSTTVTLSPPHASFKFVKAQQNGLYNTTISGIADLNHYAVAGWFKPSVAGGSPTLFSMGDFNTGQKDIVGLHTVGANLDRLYFQTVNSTGTYTLDTTGVNFGLLDGPLATNPLHASPGWHHFYMEVRGRRASAYNPTAIGRWIVVIPDGQWAYRGAWGTLPVPETDPPFPSDVTHNYDFTSLGIDLLNQVQSSSGWFADVAVWGFPNVNDSANTLYAPADWPAGLRVNYGQLVAGDCPLGAQMAAGARLLAFWPLVENYQDYKNNYDLTCGD